RGQPGRRGVEASRKPHGSCSRRLNALTPRRDGPPRGLHSDRTLQPPSCVPPPPHVTKIVDATRESVSHRARFTLILMVCSLSAVTLAASPPRAPGSEPAAPSPPAEKGPAREDLHRHWTARL